MLLATALSGCESMQRKFTRKPKTPRETPTPIIRFQDYTQAMTPVERYQKHYMLFDYWNSELMGGLQSKPVNNKQLKAASKESLVELNTLKSLVADDLAPSLDPLLETRNRIDRQLRTGNLSDGAANNIWRELEKDTRAFQRDFFWRDVQDRLKPRPAPAPSASASSPVPAAASDAAAAAPAAQEPAAQ